MTKEVPKGEQVHLSDTYRPLFGLIELTKTDNQNIKRNIFLCQIFEPTRSHFQNTNTAAREKAVEVNTAHQGAMTQREVDIN